MIWALGVIFFTAVAILTYQTLSSDKNTLIAEARKSYTLREALIEKDFRFRVKELKRRCQSGLLSKAELDEAIDELKRETVITLQRASDDIKSLDVKPKHWAWIVMLVAVGSLACAFFYQANVAEPVAQRQALIKVLKARGDDAILELEQTARRSNDRDSILAWLTALRLNLEVNPLDVEAWLAYIRANLIVDRHDLAWQSLRHAQALAPNDPRVLLAKAQLLYAKGDAESETRARAVIDALLQQNPRNFDALLIAGFGAFRAQDYQRAIEYWERASALVPSDSERAQLLRNSIDTARARWQQKAQQETRPKSGIKVLIQLSEKNRHLLSEHSVIYVIARAADGAHSMPIAVARIQVEADRKLYEVWLDDNASMRPSDRLSAYQYVDLTIRLSPSGVAEDQSGPTVTRARVSTVSSDPIRVQL